MSVGEGTKVGQYLILEHLGGGGQGEVFRAEELTTGRYVALKRIWLGRDSDGAERLRQVVRRKASALAGLHDPHIVQLYDWGECPDERTSRDPLGFLYIIYELVEGATTLRKVVRTHAVTLPAVSLMLGKLAATVQRIHDNAISHRDIKPENIMLRGGDHGAPVLIDFGSMKVDGSSTLTHSGFGHGTVGYMAPEMSVDPKGADLFRADQWSLARTFCEAIAVSQGASPRDFESRDARAPLDWLRRHLPHTYEAFAQALSVRPEHRFTSVGVFAEAAARGLQRDGHDLPYEAASSAVWVPAWLQHTVDGMKAVLGSWSRAREVSRRPPSGFDTLRDHATGEFPVQIVPPALDRVLEKADKSIDPGPDTQ